MTPVSIPPNGTPTIHYTRSGLSAVISLFQELAQQANQIDELARWTADLIVSGARVLVCGNGGSASEAQHFVTELLGRYCAERRPLPAVALSADGALLTCISNDYAADEVFSRQVRGLGQPGDLLVALTTSGQSRNVIAAVSAAKARGLHTLALLGKGGGALAGQAEREWIVPSCGTARIQEAHLFFIHVVCDYIDQWLMDS
ncbi:MAG: SIS domain-containing protein [Gemmataceae bacterium]